MAWKIKQNTHTKENKNAIKLKGLWNELVWHFKDF